MLLRHIVLEAVPASVFYAKRGVFAKYGFTNLPTRHEQGVRNARMAQTTILTIRSNVLAERRNESDQQPQAFPCENTKPLGETRRKQVEKSEFVPPV